MKFFLIGKIKYFCSNKIGIEDRKYQNCKNIIWKRDTNISYLQLYYLENYNFHQSITDFRKHFKRYHNLEKEQIKEIIKEENIIVFFIEKFIICLEEIKKNKIIRLKILNNDGFVFKKSIEEMNILIFKIYFYC